MTIVILRGTDNLFSSSQNCVFSVFEALTIDLFITIINPFS